MTEVAAYVTAYFQFSSKKYDTYACGFLLNGSRVFVTFKLSKDAPLPESLKLEIDFNKGEEVDSAIYK